MQNNRMETNRQNKAFVRAIVRASSIYQTINQTYFMSVYSEVV